MRRAVLLLVVLAACDNRNEARVGGAVLPQALSAIPLPGGATTVVVTPGAVSTVPAGAVQLAIDVNVPWSQVRPMLAAKPALVVGDRDKLRGFLLEDVLDGDADAVKIIATARGKFCLAPPGTDLAYCMESSDRRHISAAFVREVMRKAVDEYGITQARVDVEDGILWADVVRTIDGARTCCNVPVKVALLH
jgi:hypothetical protein